MKYDFAVVGGDKRLSYLVKFLIKKNFKVVGLGLSKLKNENCKFYFSSSWSHILSNSRNWILPVPVSRDGVFLNCSDGLDVRFKIDELAGLVKKDIGIFGGAFSPDFFSVLNSRAGFVYDYLKNESFAVFNASLTAQAAVAQALLKSPVDFTSRRCLVLGFGRCGKLLALKLKSFCREVVVCMRNELEMAWANAFGFEVLKFLDLENGFNLKQFSFVFNTIPKKILTGELLEKLNREVFVLDITSNGIDREEFERKSIDAFVSLQIPGNFKFKSSAKYLSDLVVKIAKEKASI